MKHLREEIKILKFDLSQAKKEIVQVKKENERLKQAINLNIFANDDFDQYNRRENIWIYGVPEISGKKNDGEDVLFQIAEKLNIELDEWDIQRCHRLGKKSFSSNKTNVGSYSKKKPHLIIMRFLSFKKRNKFLFSKSKLKTSERFPNIYLTEDLTQLRYKLLNYVKTKCGNKFVMCHTYNGKIRMKECGKKKESGLMWRHQKTYSN